MLKNIAWTRWSTVLHSGALARLLATEPRVNRSGRELIRASTSFRQGRWLADLAAAAGIRMGNRPIQVVELGTCIGISGMYLLAGMSRANGGHLTTFEGLADRAALARHNMRRFIDRFALPNVTFDVRVGRFEETVPAFFETAEPLLDLVFIDGNHREQPTVEYHGMAVKRMAKRGIIVHDDIAWSPGMVRAWNTIRESETCRIEELWVGGSPSRGVLYLGEGALIGATRHHLDGPWERALRQFYRVSRRIGKSKSRPAS